VRVEEGGYDLADREAEEVLGSRHADGGEEPRGARVGVDGRAVREEVQLVARERQQRRGPGVLGTREDRKHCREVRLGRPAGLHARGEELWGRRSEVTLQKRRHGRGGAGGVSD
jgi:hypothetical protein